MNEDNLLIKTNMDVSQAIAGMRLMMIEFAKAENVGVKTPKTITQAFNQMSTSFANIENNVGSFSKEMDQATGSVEAFFKTNQMLPPSKQPFFNDKHVMAAKKYADQQKQILRRQKEMARLGLMFSTLFGGIMMEQFGKTLLNIVLPAMDKFENMKHKGVKETMAMSAAFEFLRFSIFDTFSQTDLFANFIKFMIRMADWISELVQKNPALSEAIFIIGSLLTLFGTALVGVGFIAQSVTAIDELVKLVAKGFGTDGKGGTAGKSLKGLKGFLETDLAKGLSISIGATAIGFGIANLDSMFTDAKTTMSQRLITSAQLILGSALVGWGFGGPAGALIGLTIGIAVSLVANIVDIVLEKKHMDDAITSLSRQLHTSGITSGSTLGVGGMSSDDVKSANKNLGEQAARSYVNMESRLSSLQDGINSGKSKNVQLDAQTIQSLREQLTSINANTRAFDDNFDSQIEYYRNLNLGASAQISANRAAVNAFAEQNAEQLKTKDSTLTLIANYALFATTISDSFTKYVIPSWDSFKGKIIETQTVFDTLQKDIDDWAAVETVKTVKIRYVEEGKSGSVASSAPSTKNDKYVSSQTGGSNASNMSVPVGYVPSPWSV